MVAEGLLDKDFINLDFWSEFPRKLSLAKSYLLKKKKTVILLFRDFLLYELKIYFLFFFQPSRKGNTILTIEEEKCRVEEFLDALRENGVTHHMRNKKG